MNKIKKLLSLTLALSLVLSLTACSSSQTQSETAEPTLVEDYVYVAIDTEELDLDSLVLPLDDFDYVSIEIDEELSDYDLSTAGEYTLVLILTDEEGEITKVSLTLVVDEEEVVVEKVTEQIAAKLASGNTTLSDLLATLDESSDGTSSSSSSSSSNSSSSSSSSSSSWNGGLNTDPTVYGLDPDNIYVQVAMTLLGETYLCGVVAGLLYGRVRALTGESQATVGSIDGVDWETVYSQLEIGDAIYYYNLSSGSSTVASHVAVYLGNGLALHGNWTGGVARIANAYQVAESYGLQSPTHTVSSTSSSTCSSCSTDSGSSGLTTPEEVLDGLGIDYSGFSKETTCDRDIDELTSDELSYCIAFGYTDYWFD